MQARPLPRFETPTLYDRMRSMLGVDFYRLFHTPMVHVLPQSLIAHFLM